jgi:hypothetical protein
MNVMTTVETIKEQLIAQGLKTRGQVFVKMDENTLKVSRGDRGVIITYANDTDTYSVTYYKEFAITGRLENVTVDNLLTAVRNSY